MRPTKRMSPPPSARREASSAATRGSGPAVTRQSSARTGTTSVRRHPARCSVSSLKGLFANPSSATGARRASSSVARAARATLSGSQPTKSSAR